MDQTAVINAPIPATGIDVYKTAIVQRKCAILNSAVKVVS